MNWIKIATTQTLLKVVRRMIFVFDQEKGSWDEGDSILYDDLKALEMKLQSRLTDYTTNHIEENLNKTAHPF